MELSAENQMMMEEIIEKIREELQKLMERMKEIAERIVDEFSRLWPKIEEVTDTLRQIARVETRKANRITNLQMMRMQEAAEMRKQRTAMLVRDNWKRVTLRTIAVMRRRSPWQRNRKRQE